jgi:drug/metabolite transporter (DMT)-like permease
MFDRPHERKRFYKGIVLAVTSSITYGLFSVFLYLGENTGSWSDWWALPFAASAAGFLFLCMIGEVFVEFFAGLFVFLGPGFRERLVAVGKLLKSRNGLTMIGCAFLGGPVATTSYCIGLLTAGGVVAAITATCSVIGAAFGHFVFGQKLSPRMICGMMLCLLASVAISGTALFEERISFVGCAVSFIAALGWGIEGCVGGVITASVDGRITVLIREWLSAFTELFFVLPLLGLALRGFSAGAADVSVLYFLGETLRSPGLALFLLAGFFAVPSCLLWYRGNALCGTALGMSCNSLYLFWVPFFMWLIVDVLLGFGDHSLSPLQWGMIFVDFLGILLIAGKPAAAKNRREGRNIEE